MQGLCLRYAIWVLFCTSFSGHAFAADTCPVAENLPWEVVASKPHDPNLFTQGLVFVDDTLAESTGLYGQSRVLLHHPRGTEAMAMPRGRFGEGLTFFDQKLWQLSWKAGELHVFQTKPLEPLKTLHYDGEGWGLSHNGDEFVMSDGSEHLSFRNSTDFHISRSITVRDQTKTIKNLNELEWVEGQIFANIWQTDRIARIDPISGCVSGWLDLTELWPRFIRPAHADVLNGIAWHAETRQLWVTGKFWPRLYALKLTALTKPSPTLDTSKH